MRAWLALAAFLLAGCARSSVPDDNILYDDVIEVPAGLTGYVDAVLDTDRDAAWSWSADQDIGARWQLRCPGADGDGAAQEVGRSGSGKATGQAI